MRQPGSACRFAFPAARESIHALAFQLDLRRLRRWCLTSATHRRSAPPVMSASARLALRRQTPRQRRQKAEAAEAEDVPVPAGPVQVADQVANQTKSVSSDWRDWRSSSGRLLRMLRLDEVQIKT